MPAPPPDAGPDPVLPDTWQAVEVGAPGLPSDAWQGTCRAPATPPRESPVRVRMAFPNLALRQAVALLQAPGDSATWYAVEQGVEEDAACRVVAFHNSPEVSTTRDVLVVPKGLVYPGIYGEGGLLGFAFAPDWPTSGVAYVSYTTHSVTSPVDLRSVVSRVRSLDGGQTLDFDTVERLLELDQPEAIHNGGTLVFGPDGMLYVALGDGGADPDTAQDLGSLLGKILRLDVSASAGAYSIPPDNPFADTVDARGEVFALGLRSPWKFSFDRKLGTLWVGDVGAEEYEEANRAAPGANFGWPVLEGYACYSGDTCDPTGFTEPAGLYRHVNPETEEPTGNQAITGGYVYRGAGIPELVGTYVFVDFLSGEVMGIEAEGGFGQNAHWLASTHRMVVSMAEAHTGELYLLDYAEGAVFVLEAAPPSEPFPQTLSATGCVDPKDPTRPAAGLIPYDLNVPFWSDGATKRRWLALPQNASIERLPDGDLEFPVGTVFMKEFQLVGTRVETRLFARHEDGTWAGYSYRWNEAGTDADLVDRAGAAAVVLGQRWIYPARNHCNSCHNEASVYVLGPELQQLERQVTYESTGVTANQLDTWIALGLFEEPPPLRPPGLPDPTDESLPLDQRARAYLHANCAYCHREGGVEEVVMDLRYGVPLANAGVCDKPAQLEDFGFADMLLLTPGDPERSALLRRIRSEDRLRMPPLSTRLVDVPGASLIESWIASLTACGP